jgi:hypothetical protein
LTVEKISKDKQYVTVAGQLPYRCYATDAGGDYPVHGSVCKEGKWESVTHNEFGFFRGWHAPHPYDLVEVKRRIKIERWALVGRDGGYSLWLDKPSNACSVDAFGLTRISFEVEEGEGLE